MKKLLSFFFIVTTCFFFTKTFSQRLPSPEGDPLDSSSLAFSTNQAQYIKLYIDYFKEKVNCIECNTSYNDGIIQKVKPVLILLNLAATLPFIPAFECINET